MPKIKTLTTRYNHSNSTVNVLCEISVGYFLEIIKSRKLLKDNKFEEQRNFLDTRKAKIIQQKLEKDIRTGTQLPPISIGVVDESIEPNKNLQITEKEIAEYINNNENFLAIVDGIQRSNILKYVYEGNRRFSLDDDLDLESNLNLDDTLILDFLITNQKFNLLNRMFVLNFGQTPWGEEQQANIIWNILDLKTNMDKRFKATNLLTFLYAYVNNKYDKVINDELDYFYTNLSLLEDPIDKNITGELFDNIYRIAYSLGDIIGKNTVLTKTACFAAFANTTKYIEEDNSKLVEKMAKITEILSPLKIANYGGLHFMQECLSTFKSAVGQKQRKFFYTLFSALFEKVMSGELSISEDDFISMCSSAKEEVNTRKED